jgi:hypothetical protein
MAAGCGSTDVPKNRRNRRVSLRAVFTGTLTVNGAVTQLFITPAGAVELTIISLADSTAAAGIETDTSVGMTLGT